MPIQLSTSTLSPFWRDVDIGDMLPPPKGPGWLSERETQQIVAAAKKRLDLASRTNTNVDYGQLIINQAGDLKGLCFIAADEFAQYFSRQGYDAKPVKVSLDSSDHYFTIVNLGSKANSLIVDGTWRQFHTGGHALRYGLIGTLTMLETALAGTQTQPSVLAMYKAGMAALKTWKTYRCFSG